MNALNTTEIIEAARKINLEADQAMYLANGEIEIGRDGCQPSNSLCLAVGPTDGLDWAEVADAIDAWASR